MAKPLINFWTEDSDGERWMVNDPMLVVASNRPRKKGKKTMAYTNRPKHGTKAWMSYIRGLRRTKTNRPRKHSKPRRNMYSAGEIANRPRTKTRTITRYVNRPRRNPPAASRGLLGLSGFPGMEQIAGATAGLVVPPVLNYFVSGYIPAAITSNTFGKYAVQAAETVLPAWLVRKYVNRNVGNTMLVVGLGKLVFDLVREFAPGIPGLSGMGYQPMLGAYTGQRRGFPALRATPMMVSPGIAGVPDRLNPQARF
jgi:hypothetical protein